MIFENDNRKRNDNYGYSDLNFGSNTDSGAGASDYFKSDWPEQDSMEPGAAGSLYNGLGASPAYESGMGSSAFHKPDDPVKNKKYSGYEGVNADGYKPYPLKREGDSYYGNFSRLIADDETRRNYAVSPWVVDDRLGDYYKNVLSASLKRARAKSKERSQEAYRNSMSVIGADPEIAMADAMRVDNPVADLESVMSQIDNNELKKRFKGVAEFSGYDLDDYIEKFVKPTIYNKLADEMIDENVPKSSVEYLLRSSTSNSLAGKISQTKLNAMSDNNVHSNMEMSALERYNPNWGEEVFAGVGSLIVDSPLFSVLGAGASGLVGKSVFSATERATAQVMVNGLGRGVTEEAAKQVAKRAIHGKLKNRIMHSALTQGLTLGSYDIANSVADDILINNEVKVGKAASSFVKGMGTGIALGAVGTPLREAANKLRGAVKKSLAAAGVLCAESGVFTGVQTADKLLHGVEISPIDLANDFAKSAATLGVMKLSHLPLKGADYKLDKYGELKKGLKLSISQKVELSELEMNVEQFMDAIVNELKLPTFGGKRSEYIRETYAKIMADENVSLATKSKLMFLVENKLTSTPPVPFDFDAKRNDNGTWDVILFDAAGNKISTQHFDHAGNAKSHMLMQKALLRQNRICFFENELTRGVQSQNFLYQAGRYAMEKGVDVDKLADALYKKSTGEKLSAGEDAMIEEIIERSSYTNTGMLKMLADTRNYIEEKHDLHRGNLMEALGEPFFKNTVELDKALDEYERVIREHVDELKNGTRSDLAEYYKNEGLGSEYAGMTAEEVRKKEADAYTHWLRTRNDDRHNGESMPMGTYSNSGSTQKAVAREADAIAEIHEGENKYITELDSESKANLPQHIKEYGKHAQAVADKLGVDIHIIYSKKQIRKPVSAEAQAEYNTMLWAEGWMDKDGIYVNLSNMNSKEMVEKTMLHEVVGHKGLYALFGPHLNEFLEDVLKKATPDVVRGIEKQMKKYDAGDKYVAIEEYLAHLAESTVLSPQERSFYSKVKDYMRDKLGQMGLYSGSRRRISEEELRKLMQRHCEYIVKRTNAADYRRRVFGSFKAAHGNNSTYYDKEGYNRRKASAVADGSFLNSTPRYLKLSKMLHAYEFLPEEGKKRIRDIYGVSDEFLKGYFEKRYKKPDSENGRNGEFHIINVNKDVPREKPVNYESIGSWGGSVGLGKKLFKNPIQRILNLKSPNYARLYQSIVENKEKEHDSYDTQMYDQLTNMALEDGYKIYLKDVVNDNAFFSKYPELSGMPVEFSRSVPFPVYYDKGKSRMLINSRMMRSEKMDTYLMGAMEMAAKEYDRERNEVETGLDEINVGLKEKYENAVDVAKKLRSMQKSMPLFDPNSTLNEMFEKEYGFEPAEFLRRFPNIDDYFIYRVAQDFPGARPSLGNAFPEGKNADGEISSYRRYFQGPYEIIVDAVRKNNRNGVLKLRDAGLRSSSPFLTPLDEKEIDREFQRYLNDEGYDDAGGWNKGVLERFKDNRTDN